MIGARGAPRGAYRLRSVSKVFIRLEAFDIYALRRSATGGLRPPVASLRPAASAVLRLESAMMPPAAGGYAAVLRKPRARLLLFGYVWTPVRGRSAPQEAYKAGRPRGRGLPRPLAWLSGEPVQGERAARLRAAFAQKH